MSSESSSLLRTDFFLLFRVTFRIDCCGNGVEQLLAGAVQRESTEPVSLMKTKLVTHVLVRVPLLAEGLIFAFLMLSSPFLERQNVQLNHKQ